MRKGRLRGQAASQTWRDSSDLTSPKIIQGVVRTCNPKRPAGQGVFRVQLIVDIAFKGVTCAGEFAANRLYRRFLLPFTGTRSEMIEIAFSQSESEANCLRAKSPNTFALP